MTVPYYPDLRRAVHGEAAVLTHPTKQDANGDPTRYGSVVYFEGGHVGMKTNAKRGRYLIAEGDEHDESIWALAQKLGLVDYGPKVKITEVSAGHFWLRCAAGR